MSVTTRTNLIPNPSFETGTTGWAGTNCTLAQSTSAFKYGSYSMSVTSGGSGGAFSFTTPSGTSGIPVSASTAYVFQIESEAAATTNTPTLSITWYNSSGTSISTSSLAMGVADSLSSFVTWSLGTTSPATAAYASVQVAFSTSVASEVHYIDAAMLEATSSLGSYFDGSFTNTGGVMYAWSGSVGNSSSTATIYVPATALASGTTPCPYIQLTLTDYTPSNNTVNVWRTSDGVREAVRGARHLTFNGSTVIYDYEVPLGRQVQYDVEVVSGYSKGAVPPSQTTTVAAPVDAFGKPMWWIQDPRIPGTAIALSVQRGDPNHPSLTAAAVKKLEFSSDVQVLPIMGSSSPIAIGGSRLKPQNVPFHMFTDTASQTSQLQALLQGSITLLIRPPGNGRESNLPGSWYVMAPKPTKVPWTTAWGGTLTEWQMEVSTVAAPKASVLVPTWTYGNVQSLWIQYQNAQNKFSGKSYLYALQHPTG